MQADTDVIPAQAGQKRWARWTPAQEARRVSKANHLERPDGRKPLDSRLRGNDEINLNR